MDKLINIAYRLGRMDFFMNPFMDYDMAVKMVYIGCGVHFVFVAVTLCFLFVAFCKAIGQDDIKESTASFPLTLKAIIYSEIPIGVIAVIADHLKISLNEVTNEYDDDADHRRAIVLRTFNKDFITDRFLRDYQPKFLRSGYVGEYNLE